MGIVRLKTLDRDVKVNELFQMFKLPLVSSQGYQTKPRPELTGGSAAAVNPVEALRLKAINELRNWTRKSLV